jgi:hypothetical protein
MSIALLVYSLVLATVILTFVLVEVVKFVKTLFKD